MDCLGWLKNRASVLPVSFACVEGLVGHFHNLGEALPMFGVAGYPATDSYCQGVSLVVQGASAIRIRILSAISQAF